MAWFDKEAFGGDNGPVQSVQSICGWHCAGEHSVGRTSRFIPIGVCLVFVQVDLALRVMKDGAERARKRLSLGAKGVAKNFSPMKTFEKKIFSPMMTKMFTPTKRE